MKKEYLCPKCRSSLNPGKEIIFSARTSDNKIGLVLLSDKLGDYSAVTHPSFPYVKGQKVTFFCPVCHEDLESMEINRNLAKVLMIDEDNKEYEIIFSEITGENCTYVIRDNYFRAFGDNSEEYMNFFGESPKYENHF